MNHGKRYWNREEVLLALNLYCKTPFGKMHRGNPEIVKLSELLGRTPSSVAYKLVNLASLDPSLQNRGIKGASNASKLDKQVWNEFWNNMEDMSFESERLRAKYEGKPFSDHLAPSLPHSTEGREKARTVKQRVNQQFFRNMVLACYNDTCCITGIKHRDLLVAGHIKPWSVDAGNRLNPRNGIAINALHDRAFEVGLLSIDANYKIKVAAELLNSKDKQAERHFGIYHNREIILPSKFLPGEAFLNYHYTERFRG